MTPATARRLSALERAAAMWTKDPFSMMTLDEQRARIAEYFGHEPTTEELRQELRRLMAGGADTVSGAT